MIGIDQDPPAGTDRDLLAWLKTREETYAFLIDHTQDIYYSLTFLPKIAFNLVGGNVEQLTGYTAESFYGDPEKRITLFHPEDQAVLNALYEGHIAPENPVPLRVIHRDGHEIWMELRCRIRRNERRELVAVEGLLRDISQKMRTEDLLRASQARFRVLFDKAPDGMYLHDLEGTIVDLNEESLSVYGVPRSEMIGRNLIEVGLLDDTQREQLRRLLPILKTESKVGPLELVYYNREGQRRIVELYSHIIEVESERLVLTTARDLTLRKEAEESLNESRELLRLAMQNAGIALWVVDQRGIMKIFGGLGMRKLGWTPQNTIGRSIYALAANYPGIGSTVQEGLLGHAAQNLIDIPQLDTCLEVHCTPFFGAAQQIIGVLGVSIDVTARVRAESALMKSKHQLETIVAAVQAGILIIDRATQNVVEANQTALDLLKVSHQEIIGQPCRRFVCEGSEAEACPMEVSEKAQARLNIDCWAHCGDGHRIPVLKSIVPITYKGAPHYLESFIDITRRKEFEEMRRLTEKQVLQTQRMESLSKLAGGVAHDFNNLLTAVIGNLSLIMMDLEPDSELRGALSEIDQAAQQAVELAQQMLAYSGQNDFNLVEFELSDFLRETRPFLEKGLPPGANLTLCEASEPLIYLGDTGWLRTALINLVINAKEALKDSGGEVRLSVGRRHFSRVEFGLGYMPEALPPGVYGYIDVKDSGCGMKADELPLIFDPFFSTKFTGRGIGLAALLGIMRGHHGGVQVQSEEGVGTSFRLFFPEPGLEAPPTR